VVGRAQALLDQATREHRRTKELHARDVAAEQDLEREQHELRLARIELNDARAETAARAAAVDQARELLRQAERDLENSVVRAPIDGIVIEREGEIGRAVADVTADGGTVIAIIADDRRIRLLAEVDENEIARVRVGQTAEIVLDAFPEESFQGRVRKISAAGTSVGNVSNFEIELELAADERLRVGMSADARVVVREFGDSLLVPNRALVRRDEATLLRRSDVAGGDGFELVPVRTGYSDGFRTIVEDGVDEGDVIFARSDGGRE
jgi:HlyD family secretion protein